LASRIPLLVDNTVATPLLRPFEHGNVAARHAGRVQRQ
jgi:O-acetylhomoserine/O-acetylserine sulfhydrylase-like pyridoxal-dependent enzyme